MAINPFKRHRAVEMAKLETADKVQTGEQPELRGDVTEQDRARKKITELGLQLKMIRSTQAKAEFKAEHLAELSAYVDGVMAADIDKVTTLPQDNEFMTVLVWTFDACLLADGHKLSSFARAQGWQMPPMMQLREVDIFILTRLVEIAKPMADSPDEALIGKIIEVAADSMTVDMHDKLGFNVQVMMGDLNANLQPATALKHYQQAVKIKSTKHGLLKKMKALVERIEPLQQAANNDDDDVKLETKTEGDDSKVKSEVEPETKAEA
ncbi:MAG: hypothetical protein COA90_00945 [Gammaproteobacteria bacterium]|nr:MAG: hypothetical protein COA90_00945 [Gammaproteobacteria bacterium]